MNTDVLSGFHLGIWSGGGLGIWSGGGGGGGVRNLVWGGEFRDDNDAVEISGLLGRITERTEKSQSAPISQFSYHLSSWVEVVVQTSCRSS